MWVCDTTYRTCQKHAEWARIHHGDPGGEDANSNFLDLGQARAGWMWGGSRTDMSQLIAAMNSARLHISTEYGIVAAQLSSEIPVWFGEGPIFLELLGVASSPLCQGRCFYSAHNLSLGWGSTCIVRWWMKLARARLA